MNDTRVARAGLAPWHLWLVGLPMLVWNAMSCYSYVMTWRHNDAHFRATGMTPEIAAYNRQIQRRSDAPGSPAPWQS